MYLGIILLIISSLQPHNCQSCSPAYNRLPENNDITVTCGSADIQLSINVCPVYFASFLPSDLALNGKHNNTECLGIMDTASNPPVLRFTLHLDGSVSNVCGNFIDILNEVGVGQLSAYSNVQAVRISGFVDSLPLAEMGMVSYSTNLYYNFSCHYPLQYILNNTSLLTSFGAVAINNNTGSFISTLQMRIFTDENFTTEATANSATYGLKRKIYVQVASNNTAMSYNVNLEECFATPSPIITVGGNDSYSFFVSCSKQNKTSIIQNGESKTAKFSFEAFRFLQHSGQKTSSIYLHCITRLCLADQCPKCPVSRKRREVNADTEQVMISSGPIYVTGETDPGSSASPFGEMGGSNSGGTSLLTGNHSGLAVGLIIAAIIRAWP